MKNLIQNHKEFQANKNLKLKLFTENNFVINF